MLCGFRVVPKTSDEVSMDSSPIGTVVFAWTKAPASWRRRTIAEDVAAGLPTFAE